MDTFVKIVNAFRELKVAVLGDLMLDRYTWGQATRISQEAPVPVVLVQRQSMVPGGAANVVRNVLSLRGASSAFGLVGEDGDGLDLLRLLRQAGARTEGVSTEPGCVTTVKTRILAGAQQVVRVDREVPSQVTESMREKLLERLDAQLEATGCQALIMEDYSKGVFTREFMMAAVKVAESHHVFVTLDPHPNHSFNVQGLKLMTPNRMEAFNLAGIAYEAPVGDPLHDAPLLRVGEVLRRLWNPELLLITLGAEGMILFPSDGTAPTHIPTQAQRVFDVSGAGDTVMATMTLALLAGARPADAAAIANHAAGIVVGYVGTRAIGASELIEKLAGL